jgi:hypothetical protein
VFEVSFTSSISDNEASLDLLFFRWAQQREVFGKPLNAQAVIRSKLAQMISRVEACQNWLESITYQMNDVSCFLSDSSF